MEGKIDAMMTRGLKPDSSKDYCVNFEWRVRRRNIDAGENGLFFTSEIHRHFGSFDRYKTLPVMYNGQLPLQLMIKGQLP